ncbi:hypothetical protein [Loktanella salsilacus]|uniref:hypothetical protein n=1 Tax=Loktanella salsilacus TaxID=195913 RepID=UPI003002183B
MTNIFKAMLSAGFCVAATAAASQSLTGGDVTATYGGLTDSDYDASGYNLSASGEIGFDRVFALQGDLSYTDTDLGLLSSDTIAFTGHAIYHANEFASFGMYYGQESSDGDDLKYYGVEGGYEATQLKVEGYFGISAIDLGDAFAGTDFAADGAIIGDFELNQAGVQVAYDVNEMFTVMGRYDQIHFTDALSFDRIGAGVSADLGNNIGLSAELGRLSTDLAGLSDDVTYANIGATYTFGAERGATFGARDSAHTLTGF